MKRSGRAMDAWAALDEILGKNLYTRFSLHAHRDWDNSSLRKWDAVLFNDSGKILVRVSGATREEAVAALIRAHECIEK